MAVAFAVLVLLAVALGVVVPVPLGAVVVELAGAVVGVELVDVGLLVVLLVVGAVEPLAAVPEPLTVAALIVVEPVAFTSPEPLLVASTTVEPDALVLVVVVVGLGAAVGVELVDVGLLVVLLVVGAVEPLAAVPEPLTVAALIVVEPVAFTSPEPLLIALTVLDPMAFVVVVCAKTELSSTTPRAPMLTAAAIILLACGIFNILSLLSVSP